MRVLPRPYPSGRRSLLAAPCPHYSIPDRHGRPFRRARRHPLSRAPHRRPRRPPHRAVGPNGGVPPLSGILRKPERTHTADLLSLRVRGRAFLSVAGAADPAYLGRCTFPALPGVPKCCVRVGVKLGSRVPELRVDHSFALDARVGIRTGRPQPGSPRRTSPSSPGERCGPATSPPPRGSCSRSRAVGESNPAPCYASSPNVPRRFALTLRPSS